MLRMHSFLCCNPTTSDSGIHDAENGALVDAAAKTVPVSSDSGIHDAENAWLFEPQKTSHERENT